MSVARRFVVIRHPKVFLKISLTGGMQGSSDGGIDERNQSTIYSLCKTGKALRREGELNVGWGWPDLCGP